MKQTNLPPPTFTPPDPDALYTALMDQWRRIPQAERFGSDPSRYFCEVRGHYITDGGKTGDQRAQELRWFAREWRRRA